MTNPAQFLVADRVLRFDQPLVLDLANMRGWREIKVLGLIGFPLLHQYVASIDWRRGVFSLGESRARKRR